MTSVAQTRMSKLIRSVDAAVILLAGLSGCGEELPSAGSSATLAPTKASLTASVLPAPTPALELRSDRYRSVPSVGPADLDELVRGSNAFAFDPYHALKDGDSNLFYKT